MEKRITITPHEGNQWKCEREGFTGWHEFECAMLSGLSFVCQEVFGKNEIDVLDILPRLVNGYCNNRKDMICNGKENKAN